MPRPIIPGFDDPYNDGPDGRPLRIDEFVIRETLTLFEWCTALADRHPWPSGNGGEHSSDMAHREAWVGARAGGNSERSPEHKLSGDLYREAVADIRDGRIVPLRRAYCSDTGSEDLTRFVVAEGDMLALVKRRGDEGRIISELLIEDKSTSGAEVRCLRWLRELAAADSGLALSARPKAHWKAQASARPELKGLSDRAFARAWSNAASDFPKIGKSGRKRGKAIP